MNQVTGGRARRALHTTCYRAARLLSSSTFLSDNSKAWGPQANNLGSPGFVFKTYRTHGERLLSLHNPVATQRPARARAARAAGLCRLNKERGAAQRQPSGAPPSNWVTTSDKDKVSFACLTLYGPFPQLPRASTAGRATHPSALYARAARREPEQGRARAIKRKSSDARQRLPDFRATCI